MAQIDLETHSEQEPSIKNVQVKNVKEKLLGKVGEIAHYHQAESDTHIWEEACLFVEHVVRDPAGFRINDTRYIGKVVVPQCVSNDLAGLEGRKTDNEIGIFQNRGKQKFLRELHG